MIICSLYVFIRPTKTVEFVVKKDIWKNWDLKWNTGSQKKNRRSQTAWDCRQHVMYRTRLLSEPGDREYQVTSSTKSQPAPGCGLHQATDNIRSLPASHTKATPAHILNSWRARSCHKHHRGDLEHEAYILNPVTFNTIARLQRQPTQIKVIVTTLRKTWD